MMPEQQLDASINQLRPDNFVTINIDPEDGRNISVKIQKCLLEATSQWFRHALEEDRWLEGQARTISFREDDPALWTLLLYFIIHRRLPSDFSDWYIAARCWLLGDKYDIPHFQDICMVYILREFSPKGVHHIREKLGLLTELITNMPSSCSLLSLIAEEVAYAIYMGNLDWFELMCFDGTDGFWTLFLAWYSEIDQYEEWSRRHFEELEIVPRYEGSHWEEFMVGELHPIFDIIQARESQ